MICRPSWISHARWDDRVVDEEYDNDTTFATLQGLFMSGDPCDVSISDAGGTLSLTCEVMQFNVNQNLEEVISADVTLKPTQSTSGTGSNVPTT